MRTAYLSVGERRFRLRPDDVEQIASAAAAARASGEWLEFREADGGMLRMLIPADALLIIQEYDISDDFDADQDPNDWRVFDYDV